MLPEIQDEGKMLHSSVFSTVYLIDGKSVRKYPEASQFPDSPLVALENETCAYKTIGPHPRIARWIPAETAVAEYVEIEYYPHRSIRDYMQKQNNQVPLALRIKWGAQMIEALAVIHAKGVIHSDLKLEQYLLDNDMNARLSDFNAASCPGRPALGYEKATHFLPRPPEEDNTVRTDLFALGSTLYELAYGNFPYHELYPDEALLFSSSDSKLLAFYHQRQGADAQVERAYEQGLFPDVSGSFCQNTILGCWNGNFASAQEALLAYKSESRHMSAIDASCDAIATDEIKAAL
ncbi:hypothetical protein HRR83_000052 [Exophiala dermatitidis]|uniref:Protein kinase domain-containing protein n=2 Tax=Exophiala dermatitidis TaxID=5970 RepID=H6C863_EXODN|nr:uncharacterized protein HMPREF1120_08257 [Exophiala dermatitidis NIH/UT8656]XP_009160751.1 hypothetical protein, variant [Exophiala dermatitidis NIH/UT8656]KAJ4523405.1 hypothetical protein HRR73_002586 [Exophiala dermatitidis]EHY60289.1 hypothetical protein, variant [Exophiala dermatitidis NIH/UT8656]EHY60290.1 hypothetical protein HMPREF1120_08257 [Exophiala dermatitidis NIH/UT8656]KAJ4524457.1 hypothetical protein HRR75_000045 [Exophiala dermatitidis]KAJ4527301.1 hypothetical protein HR